MRSARRTVAYLLIALGMWATAPSTLGAQAAGGRPGAGATEREITRYASEMKKACAAQDTAACAEFGRLHVWVTGDSIANLPEKRRDMRGAIPALTTACDVGGDGMACVRLGKALRATTKSEKWHAPKGAHQRYEQGCTKGAGAGCDARAETVTDWAVRAYWWEKGCELGSKTGCTMAAHVFGGYFAGVDRVVPRDTARALTNFDRACALGDADACTRLAPLLLSAAKGATPDTARAIPLLQATCRAGVPTSCVLVGDVLMAREDSFGARASYDRACSLHLAAACERLVASAEDLPGSGAAEEAQARVLAARAIAAFGGFANVAGRTYLYTSKDRRYAFRMAVRLINEGRTLVLDEGLQPGPGMTLTAVDGSPFYHVANETDPNKPATAQTYRARKLADGSILVWHGNSGRQYVAEPGLNRVRRQPVIIAADGSFFPGMEGAAPPARGGSWWWDYQPSSEQAYVAAAATGQQRQAEVRAQQGRGLAIVGAVVGAAAGAYVGADAQTTTQMMAAGAGAVDPNSAISRTLGAASGTASGGGAASSAGGSTAGATGRAGVVEPGSYPTRPMVDGLAAACPGFTEENFRTHALNGGSDQQLFSLCGQAYEYYWMYKNAIRKGYAEPDANRTYDAHAKSAAVAIDFAKG